MTMETVTLEGGEGKKTTTKGVKRRKVRNKSDQGVARIVNVQPYCAHVYKVKSCFQLPDGTSRSPTNSIDLFLSHSLGNIRDRWTHILGINARSEQWLAKPPTLSHFC